MYNFLIVLRSSLSQMIPRPDLHCHNRRYIEWFEIHQHCLVVSNLQSPPFHWLSWLLDVQACLAVWFLHRSTQIASTPFTHVHAWQSKFVSRFLRHAFRQTCFLDAPVLYMYAHSNSQLLRLHLNYSQLMLLLCRLTESSLQFVGPQTRKMWHPKWVVCMRGTMRSWWCADGRWK